MLDDAKTERGGYLGEGVSCPDLDSGEFDILRDSHAYFAVAAGHDHRNAFAGEYAGVQMIATPTCGFDSYGRFRNGVRRVCSSSTSGTRSRRARSCCSSASWWASRARRRRMCMA